MVKNCYITNIGTIDCTLLDLGLHAIPLTLIFTELPLSCYTVKLLYSERVVISWKIYHITNT